MTATCGRSVLVLGAGGGVGATLLTGGIALAWARHHQARLLELDLERGDLPGSWELPGTSTLADLQPGTSPITSEQVAAIERPHPSQVGLLPGPAAIGANEGWSPRRAGELLSAALQARHCVIDAGPVHGTLVEAAACRVDEVLIVAAATLCHARRVLRLADWLAPLRTSPPRLVVNLGREPRELGPKAFCLAVGLELAASLPRADREADALGGGRRPPGRGRVLSNVITGLARHLA